MTRVGIELLGQLKRGQCKNHTQKILILNFSSYRGGGGSDSPAQGKTGKQIVPKLFSTQVTRSEMGRYMCIAKNGVPPAVSKTIQLNVNCESLTNVDH